MKYITAEEYAIKWGKSIYTIKNGIHRGRFPEAVLISGVWHLPADLEARDRRVKSGDYKGWRNKKTRG